MISIQNLKKSYGQTLVLENVNLEIPKGSATVIIGGSGCGKSTLLRCINRLETPDSGRILIGGEDILDKNADVASIRKKMGMVYQHFNLFSHLNVMENIILAPMKVRKLTKKQAMEQAEQLLELVGLETRRFQMPSQLSGGQKQRVAIARAMAMQPEILLFDEPTSALDPTMVEEVETVIRHLVHSGMTCVIVTHEMRFARNIASQVVFLAEQGVYERGTAKEVFENPSRSLTRQFLYRARMLERTLSGTDADAYSLNSEIRAFAAPYGFGQRPSKALDYIADELLLPILRSDPKAQIQYRFIADENGLDHTALISFGGLETDPLHHHAIDDLNRQLLTGFTRSITPQRNGDGEQELKILL